MRCSTTATLSLCCWRCDHNREGLKKHKSFALVLGETKQINLAEEVPEQTRYNLKASTEKLHQIQLWPSNRASFLEPGQALVIRSLVLNPVSGGLGRRSGGFPLIMVNP